MNGRRLKAKIPVYFPYGRDIDPSAVLGEVEIAGDTAVLRLVDGSRFIDYLKDGAYIGMTVQFPAGFKMPHYYDKVILPEGEFYEVIVSEENLIRHVGYYTNIELADRIVDLINSTKEDEPDSNNGAYRKTHVFFDKHPELDARGQH